MTAGGSWSAQQLAEFLTAIANCSDEVSVRRAGIELAAEALEAEVGAIVTDAEVLTAIGFRAGAEPYDRLIEAGAGNRTDLEVLGLGSCVVMRTTLDTGDGSRLVLARSGGAGFNSEETGLVRGMGRVLSLSIRTLRVLEAERTHAKENERLAKSLKIRQLLLEASLDIQRAIATRSPLQEVLDKIVDGAASLLDADVAGLRIIDQDDPGFMHIVAAHGIAPKMLLRTKRAPVDTGIGGRAFTEQRLVVVDDYAVESKAVPAYAEDNLCAAMAFPVHANGEVIGSLVVATRAKDRRFEKADQDMLTSFAEHASLAITDARTLEEMHLAFHDSLTGLPNRALFFDRLDQALARRTRAGGEIALLFADLDRFKLINDSLGHAAGDTVLAEVALRVKDCLRGSDTAARLGGDEFAFIIEGVSSADDVVPLAVRICDSLRVPFVVGDREVFTGASIGIAVSSGQYPESGQLLREADVAMYSAKDARRGSYAVFENGMHIVALRRLDLEADLQRALEREEFTLQYQPLVDLSNNRITGVEALLRWRHPERGLVNPLEFIPLAEETGLIVPIGQWVLRQACEQMEQWIERGWVDGEFAVNVNVSPQEFHQPQFVDRAAAILNGAGIDPTRVVLELTESVTVQNNEATVSKLHALKALGLTLAIDDFGTGYSSLSYLRTLPVDILKIDKSFIDGVALGPEDSALARAILKLSQTLNLKTVAEGIETVEQAEKLVQLNCEKGQGFYFSEPLDPEALSEVLRSGLCATEVFHELSA